MQFRTLGHSGVQVSVIGLGGNTFGDTVDHAGTSAIVRTALEVGINFIDTAESYSAGRSEEFLGAALEGCRDSVVLGTKTGGRNQPGLEAGGRLTRRTMVARLEASLRRLRTDYVDLYYFHFPDPLTPVDESMRAVEDLIRSGKVRYLACSNHQAWQVAVMVGIAQRQGTTGPVASQSAYNMLERDVEREMLPACRGLGVSFVPFAPLARGFLTGKYRRNQPPAEGTRLARTAQARESYFTEAHFERLARYEAFASARSRSVGELALAWLFAHSQVASVIAGATSPDQVREHARAADWSLSDDELRELG
ncbi:MAG: aldo/keto reductase [Chloroflexi bacterium]|nr:aldo/keto reductase [Chloroflexota bacterium]